MNFKQFQKGLPAQVQRLRREAGLSQEEAAERAAITRVHWQRIESQPTNPKVETLLQIARAFGMTLTELVAAVETRGTTRKTGGARGQA